MKNKKNKIVGKKKAGVQLGIIAGLVAIVFLANMNVVMQDSESDELEVVETRRWHTIYEWTPTAGEANPGAGKSGILEIYFVNYTAGIKPPTQNTTAVIEGWAANIGATPCLGWNNTDDFTQQIKHSTLFYIIVRVRGNATHCNRTTFWYTTDLNVTWTCAGLGVGADTSMTGVASQNGTGIYLWMNFYDDNSGAGYTIGKDSTIAITSIKFDAYF